MAGRIVFVEELEPHDGHWLSAQNKPLIGGIMLSKQPSVTSPLRAPDTHLTTLAFSTSATALGKQSFFFFFFKANFILRPSRVIVDFVGV